MTVSTDCSNAAAGSLLGGSAVAHLRQVGTIAGDKADAVTSWAVTGHDDGGVECLQLVEAREPLPDAGTEARECRLSAHGEIAGKQDAVGLDPDNRIADGMIGTHGRQFRLHTTEIEVVPA